MAWNNNSKPATPVKKQRPPVLRGLIAGVIVVIAAIAAYFILSGDKPAPASAEPAKKAKPAKVVKKVAPKPAPKPAAKPAPKAPVAAKPAPVATNDAPVFTDGRVSEWSKKFSANSKWSATTNSFGQQIEIVHDNGKMHKRISYAKPPMVNNASDQALAMATAGGSGPMPPIPIPPRAEEMFRESLNHEIVINPEDSPEIRRRKEEIIQARKDMKEMLDAGESFANVINSTVKQRNADHSLRQEARSSVMNMMKEDPEGAAELIKRYNKVLRKSGIAELSADDFIRKGPGKK